MLVSDGVYEFVSLYCVGWAVKYEVLDCFGGWHVELQPGRLDTWRWLSSLVCVNSG